MSYFHHLIILIGPFKIGQPWLIMHEPALFSRRMHLNHTNLSNVWLYLSNKWKLWQAISLVTGRVAFSSIVYGSTSAFFPYEGRSAYFKKSSAKYERKNRNSIFWKFLGNYMLGNFLETICWEILGNYMLGNFLETICW